MRPLNVCYAWKDGRHFKLMLFPANKKQTQECIKKLHIQAKLDSLRKDGWTILIKKPKEGK